MIQLNLLTQKQKTYRLREGTYGCQMEMYTLLYLKCLTNKDLTLQHMGLCLMLCGSLDGRGVWERMRMLSRFCRVWLFVNLWTVLLSSSVHVILQARILEWVAMTFSRDLLNPGIELTFPMSPALAGRFFTARTTQEALGGEWVYVYVWLSPVTVHLRLSKHCLLTGYTLTEKKKSFFFFFLNVVVLTL